MRYDLDNKPVKLLPLSVNPLVAGADNFIDIEASREIISLGLPSIGPSKIWDPESKVLVADRSIRSADCSFFDCGSSDIVDSIKSKLSNIFGLKIDNCEPPCFLRYEVGQEYKAHCDAIPPVTAEEIDDLKSRGQRVFTALLYLNEEFDGGKTSFPRIGISVKPKTGRLLVWSNTMIGSSSPDPKSLHVGEPVTQGVKFALTFWFRQPPVKAQFFNLHPDEKISDKI